ncbi:hypothetical protein FRC02_000953 [Tulasnella sp. 418]|nr:hypothetical protein FRC02_000953 [Tulasnella sp. 418]
MWNPLVTSSPVLLIKSPSLAPISSSTNATIGSILRDRVPSLSSPNASFTCSSFISGGMRQTMLASLGIGSAKPAELKYEPRYIVLPDGGSIRVDLAPHGAFSSREDTKPVVILVHGILGNSQAPYILGPAHGLIANGFRVAAMNLRGCGGVRLTSAAYHNAGMIGDLKSVLLFIQSLAPNAHKFLVGCSLGAGLVTNTLADLGEESPVTAAITVSNVFSYEKCFTELKSKTTMMGLVINKSLGTKYKKLIRDVEREAFRGESWIDCLIPPPSPQTPPTTIPSTPAYSPLSPINFNPLDSSYSPTLSHTITISDETSTISSTPPTTIRSTEDIRIRSFFDSLKSRNLTMTSFSREFIAPLSGATNIVEFCDTTSSAQKIKDIRTPTLFINALDDPMFPGKHLPFDAVRRNPYTVMAVTAHGGHLGWISNEKGPDGRPTQWVVRPIVEFFKGILDAQPTPRPMMRTSKGPVPGMTYLKGSEKVGFLPTSESFIRLLPLAPKVLGDVFS